MALELIICLLDVLRNDLVEIDEDRFVVSKGHAN
jgi:transketolase N-terminal domain/subunit